MRILFFRVAAQDLRAADVLQFGRDRNIPLQTVIHGNHERLGATEWRRSYFKDITHQTVEGIKRNKLENEVWLRYASMVILHMNSQALQYGGFTHGRRVSGWAPK